MASWTDHELRAATDKQLRNAAKRLGVNPGGTRDQLIARLKETDKPTGWKWEG